MEKKIRKIKFEIPDLYILEKKIEKAKPKSKKKNEKIINNCL